MPPPRPPYIINAITLLFGAIVGCAGRHEERSSPPPPPTNRLHDAGRWPRSRAFAIFLFTHGFFKGPHVPAVISVMHGMGVRSTCASALLRVAMKGHLADLHDGLARHPRRSAILRLLVEGQDHQPPSAPTPSAGQRPPGSAGSYGPLPWSVPALTAFYMSRLFFMTFPRQEPAGPPRPKGSPSPARVQCPRD